MPAISDLPNRRKPGRPPGRQFDVVVHVRMPRPALAALKELAHREKSTISHVVRCGVMAAAARAIKPMVDVVRDKKRSPFHRIAAIGAIRACMRADLHMGPMGLKLARQRRVDRGEALRLFQFAAEQCPGLGRRSAEAVYDWLLQNPHPGNVSQWFPDQFADLVREARAEIRAARKKEGRQTGRPIATEGKTSRAANQIFGVCPDEKHGV